MADIDTPRPECLEPLHLGGLVVGEEHVGDTATERCTLPFLAYMMYLKCLGKRKGCFVVWFA